MATPKQVMDFRPSKGITTAQSNEHQRRWTEKGWGSAESTGNYDRSRERLNFEVRGYQIIYESLASELFFPLILEVYSSG